MNTQVQRMKDTEGVQGIESLPGPLLQEICRHVELYEAITTLPLVSKAFARALRKPGPRWASLCLLPYTSMLSETPEDGARANFLVWLRPRASSVTEVHACIGNSESNNNSGFLIEQLCLTLTNALVCMRIHRDDDQESGACGMFPGSFQLLTSCCERLQILDMPLNGKVEDDHIKQLAQLRHLKELYLAFGGATDEQFSTTMGFHVTRGWSHLTSLTKLWLDGGGLSSIRGMSALPHLASLLLWNGQGLCLKGIEGSTSLTSLALEAPCLRLDNGSCWDPLAVLQISQLQDMTLFTETNETVIAGAPDHLVPLHNALTCLNLRAPGWTALRLGPDGLKPFQQLQKLDLHLPMRELPFELAHLHQLRLLEITSGVYLRTAGSNDHPMDVTAIGSLGGAIELVTLRHCQLIKVQASILDLAKRPNLRHVDFTGCEMPALGLAAGTEAGVCEDCVTRFQNWYQKG
ncbi:hypothetical protein WJX84_002691 [Apatococcus fuscideae]|uniref:F-box domain-containing protein n=1 Tax=Apatococcus fuscideae TaxID=2026836 RepID=A0AAW1TDX3_9CHLO